VRVGLHDIVPTSAPRSTRDDDGTHTSHRVADYDAWKIICDEVAAAPLGRGSRFYRIWRGQDDPNRVIIEGTTTWEIAKAEANAELSDVLANSRVDISSLRIDYLGEGCASALTVNRLKWSKPASTAAPRSCQLKKSGQPAVARTASAAGHGTPDPGSVTVCIQSGSGRSSDLRRSRSSPISCPSWARCRIAV
jgi:hypothetical protein